MIACTSCTVTCEACRSNTTHASVIGYVEHIDWLRIPPPEQPRPPRNRRERRRAAALRRRVVRT